MKRITVSLKDHQLAWIQEQAEARDVTVAWFLRDLINKSSQGQGGDSQPEEFADYHGGPR